MHPPTSPSKTSSMPPPLSAALSEEELKELCKTLWLWKFCSRCGESGKCESTCPSHRLRRLSRFSRFYEQQCRIYVDSTQNLSQRALVSHADLWRVIGLVRENPDVAKIELIQRLAELRRKDQGTNNEKDRLDADVNHELAIDLAVRISTMLSCYTHPRGINLLEQGLYQAPWHQNVSLTQYLDNLFPYDNKYGNHETADISDDVRSTLTAARLRKDLGLKFRSTDDIASHLTLDRQSNILNVFQHTAVLKEHLRLTRDALVNLSTIDSLKMGALQRQLAIEVLDSIQSILFPIGSARSRAELRTLICKQDFDPDAEHFEHTTVRKPEEQRIQYKILNGRLSELYEELQDPRPHGWFEEWMQRRSSGRYIMMATLIGVIVAILLGIIGLSISILQSWIEYQAWKHPVQVSVVS